MSEKETTKKSATASNANDTEFPTYKGKPLVRSGDTIYYGSMKDDYVVRLDIKTKKKVGKLEVADKISIYLMSTDPTIMPNEAIIKTGERNGLYLALDIAEAWLSRQLAE